MGSVLPDESRFRSFSDEADGDTPIVMINLLRYRERAAYPSDFEAEPCSGREAYRRYGAVAAQTIAKVGGSVLWAGDVATRGAKPVTSHI